MTTKPTGVWLQDQDMLYRLADTKHGVSNCDEIRVTQVDGSRTMERRIERAAELMAAFVVASHEQAPAGAAGLTEEIFCDLQYAARTLAAIAERQQQNLDLIEPVNEIRIASRMAKAARTRIDRAILALDQNFEAAIGGRGA